MSRADPLRLDDYLRHILEAIDNIQTYTAGMDLSAYRSYFYSSYCPSTLR